MVVDANKPYYYAKLLAKTNARTLCRLAYCFHCPWAIGYVAEMHLRHHREASDSVMYPSAKEKHWFRRQQAQHLGLGTAETTPQEWSANIRKDTHALLAARVDSLEVLSTALEQPMIVTRRQLLDLVVKDLDSPTQN